VTATSAITDLATNPLPQKAFDVRVSRFVENTSTALREYWDRDSSGSASGGGYAESGAKGSTVEWRLNATPGQTASLYGVRQPGGGYGEVWVDGLKKATVSFYAASTAWKVPLYKTPALPAGGHTVMVRVLGTKPSASTGTSVFVDYLQVGATLVQETAAKFAFRRATTATTSASGGSYHVVTHRTSGDTGGTPSYALTFKGTGVRLYVTRWTGAGPARIYVDGVLKKTTTLTSASTQYRYLAYSGSGLTSARHTIKVVCPGTSSGSTSGVGIDFFSIT
jgi:hypothetical protein